MLIWVVFFKGKKTMLITKSEIIRLMDMYGDSVGYFQLVKNKTIDDVLYSEMDLSDGKYSLYATPLTKQSLLS